MFLNSATDSKDRVREDFVQFRENISARSLRCNPSVSASFRSQGAQKRGLVLQFELWIVFIR
jgi:hypothetical protein